MKTLQKFLEEKGVSMDAFENKTKEEQFALLKEHNEANEAVIKAIKDDVNSKVSKEDLEKMSKDLAETHAREIKALNEVNSEQGLAIKRMLENFQGEGLSASEKSQISKFISDNSEKIKELKDAGHGLIEFTTKAVDSMMTTSATNPDGIPELVGTQMAPATNVNLRGSIVDGLVNIFSTDLAAYPYTESVPKDGDYSFIGEKGTKPQIDFKIETRYAEPKKVAAHIVLTSESVKDVRGMQDIASNYLRAKHDLKRQNGILFGDGLGDNPKGATTYGRAFVAGSMALSVTTPNFMDVVNATITDVYTTHNFTDEMPYMTNVVMVNPVDFFIQLVSAKDANGLPLYPMAGLFNRVTIGGVTIVPFEDIPAGKIFVADLSRYNVTNYVPYTVRIGWINDQLITNQFTMVGESRLHAFVKKLDEQAFIYDDIATIQAAITKP